MNMLFKKSNALLMIVAIMLCSTLSIDANIVKAADDVLTSSKISVSGYQIKTNTNNKLGVSFRAVCNAPQKGSIITVNGKKYTVKNVGTIYTKDINTSGNNASNLLDKSYTELEPRPFPEEAVKGYGFKYVGKKEYLNNKVTFGYIASDSGIIETKDGYTKYVRTLTNMDAYVCNSIFVRAFVEASDEKNNDVIVYGQYASVVSVAKIAYDVYMQSKAPNIEGHNYIFNSILNKLPESNPFYKENPEEYGWSGVVGP